MSRRAIGFYSFFLVALVLVGAIYSRHGFTDLRRLQGQINRTKERTATLEIENQHLKRQVDLLAKPSDDLLERQMRDFLGWVKPSEVVYLEKSKRDSK